MKSATVENIFIFGLLCLMGLYLGKTLFAFKSGGLSLSRALEEQNTELEQIGEDGLADGGEEDDEHDD